MSLLHANAVICGYGAADEILKGAELRVVARPGHSTTDALGGAIVIL